MANIEGTDQAETLDGTNGIDQILGLGGGDLVRGLAGRDFLFGGDGDDTLQGGDGRDLLYGEDGDDTLEGGDGRDDLFGGEGDDDLDGGRGTDTLWGGVGSDLLRGRAGIDLLFGGDGDDILDGGAGLDFLSGGQGDDVLRGGGGDDLLNAGEGDDTLFGDGGDDLMRGGGGDDVLNGGRGDDVMAGGDGDDTLDGGDGDDLIRGGRGDDRIMLSLGEDRVWGGAGDDVFVYVVDDAQGASHRIFGGSGDDVLEIVGTFAQIKALGLVVDGTLPTGPGAGRDGGVGDAADALGLRVRQVEEVRFVFTELPPDPQDDAFAVDEDDVLVGDVLANDVDPDGDPLTATLVEGVDHGSLSFNDDGTFVYTPWADFNGTDGFTYAVDDGVNGPRQARATITVAPVNDAPTALDDAFGTGISAQTIVNSAFTAGSQITPALAVLGGDRLVAVWASDRPDQGEDDDGGLGVKARILDRSGAEITPEFLVSAPAGSNFDPVAAALGDDGFAVLWLNQQGADRRLILRLFDGDGQATSPEIVVAQSSLGGAVRARLERLSDGGLVAVWNELDGFGATVLARRFDADGAPAGEATQLNTGFVWPSSNWPDVSATADGGFLAAWASLTPSVASAIAVRRFDGAGAPLGDETLVEATTVASGVGQARVATLVDGGAVVIWATAEFGPNRNDVKAAVLNADGSIRTPQFLVNADADFGFQTLAEVVATPDGGFLVAWDDDETAEVYARAFDASGQRVGERILVGPNQSAGAVDAPAVAVFADGGAAIAWRSPAQGASALSDVSLRFVGGADELRETTEDAVATLAGAALLANDFDVDGDVLSLASVAGVSEAGATVVLTGGEVIYDPTQAPDLQALAEGEVLTDRLTYTVSDGAGGADDAVVLLQVTGVNDAPEAVDDAATTDDGEVVLINAVANDLDVDAGDVLTVSAVGQGANGTVDIISGLVRYAPDAGFVGADEFTYVVRDAAGAEAVGTIVIEVAKGNDDPVAENDEATTFLDQPILIPVLANDGDPDGDAVFISATVPPLFGSVEVQGDQILFTPEAGFLGIDAFSYQISDGQGGGDVASVLVTVLEVPNTPPVAVNDAFAGPEDTAIAGDVLANDSDADGDALVATLLSGVAHGTLDFGADGRFTYAPDPNFNGEDGFAYRVSDGEGGTGVATVALTVTPVNDAPQALNDAFAGDEDVVLAGNVLLNDLDVDGDVLTAALLTGAAHGEVVLGSDGGFVYTPDADFNGVDGFAYAASDGNGGVDVATVSLSVAPINDVPVAVDDAFTVAEDVVLVGDVRANDSDAEGDPLSLILVSRPVHGDLSLAQDGAFTYRPDLHFNGADAFTYRLQDDGGTSGLATVTLTVTPVADPPVARDDDLSRPEPAAEVLLNPVFSDGAQYAPRLATLADGNVVAVWTSENAGPDDMSNTGINARIVDPSGAEVVETFVVNSPLGPQSLPEVAALPGGGFAVLWNSISSYAYRTFDAAGVAKGPEVALDVITSFQGATPNIAALSDGRLVVAWTQVTPTGTRALAQIIDPATGAAEAPVFLSDGAPSLGALELAATSDGGFVAAWSLRLDDASNAVASRRFDDAGLAVGPAQVFDGAAAGIDAGRIRLDVRGDDAAVLVWSTYDASAGAAGQLAPLDLRAAILAPGGAAIVPEFVVQTDDLLGAPLAADVVALSDGGFAVSYIDTGAETLNAVRYDASGQKLRTFYDIGSADLAFALVTASGLTAFEDGGFAVAWASKAEGEAGPSDIGYRVFEDGDPATLSEDATLTTPVADLLANDFDPDGDPLAISSISAVSENGAAVTLVGSDVIYDPTSAAAIQALAEGEVLLDRFVYAVSDGTGGVDGAEVSLLIVGANDAPVAMDDVFVGDEDAAIFGDVLVNDGDPEGDPLAVTLVSGVSAGSLAFEPDGTFVYTPDADFNGVDGFVYSLSDGMGGVDTAMATLSVAAVNDAPVALDDAFFGDEDMQIAGDVVLNDGDVDGDALTATVVTDVAHGMLTLEADGSFVYTPDPDFNGTDAFVYSLSDGQGGVDTATVALTVAAVNDAPVALDDDFSGDEDAAISGDVLANDGDADGDALAVTLVSGVSAGSLAFEPDGTFVYTPDADFNGVDGFVYSLSDGMGGVDRAMATLSVAAVNDAPVALDDAFFGDEDVQIAGDVTLNDGDVDGDALTATVVTDVAHGVLTLEADGGFVYTPDPDFNGDDGFVYSVSDGRGGVDTASVSFDVAAVNDPPVAPDDVFSGDEDAAIFGDVLVNDGDADGDPLTVMLVSGVSAGSLAFEADGTFVYTPDADFSGADGFVYSLSDGNGGVDTATVTLTVTPVNDAPVALDDAFFGEEDEVITGAVLGNDGDVDGDPLTAALVVDAAHGTLTLEADGTFVYTPDPDFNGADGFVYSVSDGQGGVDTASVAFDVAAVNDAPVALDDVFSGDEDAAIFGDVVANDGDAEGDPLAVTLVSDVAQGTLTLRPDGTFVYAPDPDFNGTDGFVYSVSDVQGGVDTANVTLDIAPVNDAPTANDDVIASLVEDGFVTFDPAANDLDVDGDALEVSLAGAPANGRIARNADGSYTYVPFPDFDGTDGVDYALSDGTTSVPGSVELRVKPVNDAPFTVAPTAFDTDGVGVISFSAAEGTAILPSDVEIGPDDKIAITVVAVAGAFELPATVAEVLVTGEGTSEIRVEGRLEDVIDALDGMKFALVPGVAAIQILTEDLGASGSGGPRTSVKAVLLSDGFIRGETTDDTPLKGSSGPDFMDGREGDDQILAGSGSDVVLGGAGDDVLVSGDSDVAVALGDGDRDVMDGEAGSDLLLVRADTTRGFMRGGNGDDAVVFRSAVFVGEIDGGEGFDVLATQTNDVDLSGSLIRGIERTELVTNLSIDAGLAHELGTVLTTDQVRLTLTTGGVAFFGDVVVAAVAGGAPASLRIDGHADGSVISLGPVASNSALNSLIVNGAGGDDVILGAAGALQMRLDGRGGDDIVTGSDGDETLVGGEGEDVLNGGGGDDQISGGFGDDLLAGGEGADVFVYRPGDGTDRIVDFEDGVDLIAVGGVDFGAGPGQLSVRAAPGDAGSSEVILNGPGGEPAEILARLDGVSASLIDADDFVL